MRAWLMALACLALAACSTTDARTDSVVAIARPAPGAKVLLIQPDIQLALLTAAGMQETRADWSTQGRDNMAAAIKAALDAKHLNYQLLDPDTAMGGRTGQLLRLHEAVGASILAVNYGFYALPTHKGSFDWTLGEGARTLQEAYGADYALFVFGRGSYSSDARKVMFIVSAALGAGIPMGGQQCFASLVDLRTGRIIWFNLATAAPSADMRTADGAEELVVSLLKKLPF